MCMCTCSVCVCVRGGGFGGVYKLVVGHEVPRDLQPVRLNIHKSILQEVALASFKPVSVTPLVWRCDIGLFSRTLTHGNVRTQEGYADQYRVHCVLQVKKIAFLKTHNCKICTLRIKVPV
jgi:hypothetical protein